MKRAASSKLMHIAFLLFFLLCIVTPNLHFSKAEISEKENRTLEKCPKILTGGGINLEFSKDFESFYNDRFFGRDSLIKFNASVKSIFQKETQFKKNANVLIGKDGWSFYRGNKSEANFMNLYRFSDEQLEKGLKYLNSVKNWCDKNGKVFVFLICPDKNKIYGEYFPDKYLKIRPDTESRTFQFLNYVRKNSDVSIVYPYEDLISEKEKGNLLYYKNDTHWTPAGAYIGYCALMEEIQKHLDIERIEVNEFGENKNPKGDLVSMFPEAVFPDETTVYLLPKIKPEFEVIDGSISNPQNIAKTFCNKGKYNAVFFRDSFTTNMYDFSSNDFSEVLYYWRRNITEKDLEYIKENADVVVLECVERLLPDIIDQVFPEIEVPK